MSVHQPGPRTPTRSGASIDDAERPGRRSSRASRSSVHSTAGTWVSAGELVGVGRARPATTTAEQLDQRTRRGEQQHPGDEVRRDRLHLRRAPPGQREQRRAAEPEHDQQRRSRCAPTPAARPAAGPAARAAPTPRPAAEQVRREQAEQRGREVAGGEHEHHARTARLAARHGQAGGVGVQPDAAEPATDEHRDHGVTGLVDDGDRRAAPSARPRRPAAPARATPVASTNDASGTGCWAETRSQSSPISRPRRGRPARRRTPRSRRAAARERRSRRGP